MAQKIKVVLQARLSSSRLPAKMLLPLLDLPLAVLCARRCADKDFDFVLATSTDSSDDLLAQTLMRYDIPHYRGSLDNVLSRFVDVCTDMQDDDLVVRLTGDNPFVNAAFIKDLIVFHHSHDFDYTRTLSPQDGLPYGLSAEIVTAGLLRKIANAQPDAMDQEHVTYSLTVSGQYGLYKQPQGLDLSHLRVTIDTFEDYVRAAQAFEKTGRWDASVEDLITAVEASSDEPKFRVPYTLDGFKPQSTLALGTVQLGLPYGIANQQGQPDDHQAKAILKCAAKHGITLFDTAAAYGTSEQVIGRSLSAAQKQELTVSTKLDPLADLDESASDAEVIARVEHSVYQSLYRLGLKTLPVLMLHRWTHYHFKAGLIIKTLQQLQAQGLIQKLGASVQSLEEGLEALHAPEINFIQLPFNILDQRWSKAGFGGAAQAQKGTHIQVRSSLLQGLLTLPANQWPVQFADVAPALVDFLDKAQQKYERISKADLCLAYARSLPWVDSVVVGAETLAQLEENMALFLRNDFTPDQIEKIDHTLPFVPDNLLNPALWKG